jgi:hypothetical protein
MQAAEFRVIDKDLKFGLNPLEVLTKKLGMYFNRDTLLI